MKSYDAVVVGAGPNGLAAAIRLAQAGRSVLVREANEEVGGAAQTAELTLPGFRHDPFSAVHPLGIGSPFLHTLPLAKHGLEWIQPPAAFAHPFDDGTVAVLERSLDATAETLGLDGDAYHALMEPFVSRWDELAPDALAPLHLPRNPLLLARFGLKGLRSATGLMRSEFRGEHARALILGCSAHTGLPLDFAATASFGLILAAAGHAVGWPIPSGGAGSITRALASLLRTLGGEIETGAPVHDLRELPRARVMLLDLTPRQILRIASDCLPPHYQRRLESYRYGAGVFKADWALDEPIPWQDERCARAATVHLGGTLEEVAASEALPFRGGHSERPFVLLAQPSLFDPTRAPEGKHTAWAYCHVPNGSTRDMTREIEDQIERFAPGFRDLILARSTMNTPELQRRDHNLVGGDINGGAPMLGQLFFRPTLRINPYTTPVKRLYICSASTPPGGGVHGMCGFHAAEAALKGGL